MLSWLTSHASSESADDMDDNSILSTLDNMGEEYSFFKELVMEYQQFSNSVSEKINHLKTAQQNKTQDIIHQIKADLDQCKQSIKEMKQEIKGFDGNAVDLLNNIMNHYNNNYLCLHDLYHKVKKTAQKNTHHVDNVVGVNEHGQMNTIGHHDNKIIIINKCDKCDTLMEKLAIIEKEKTDLIQEYETNINELTNKHKHKMSELQREKAELMDSYNKTKNNEKLLTQKVMTIQQENDTLITKELDSLQQHLKDQTQIEKLAKKNRKYTEGNNKYSILHKQCEQYKIENNKLIDANNKLQSERNELLQQIKMGVITTEMNEKIIRMYDDIISNNRLDVDEQRRKIQEYKENWIKERDERIENMDEYNTDRFELEKQIIKEQYEHKIHSLEMKIAKQENEESDEYKEGDNPFEKYMSYFALRYPIEASVFSYYALIVFIIATGFHGEDECDISDQIISWIGFILFLIIPTICEIYKWCLSTEKNNTCLRILDIFMKIFILGILMLTADLRPFKCYIDNEVALEIGAIVCGTFCFIVHVFIMQINKNYDAVNPTEPDEEEPINRKGSNYQSYSLMIEHQ